MTGRDKIRVLFTIPNFITAGSGKALLAVIERLDRTRFEPAVCVELRGGELDARVESLGIPFLEQPFTTEARPLRHLFRNVRNAASPFRPHRFDIWHSYHYLDDYSEPLIARYSGARAWVYTKKNMNWSGRAWKLRSMLAKAIAAQNTDMLEQFFSSSWFRRKTALVQRGVDVDAYQVEERAGLEVRRELEIDEQDLVVGCLANLVAVKGLSTLIEAIEDLPCRLVIAGAPHDRAYVDSLEAQVRDRGLSRRVTFAGHRSDVPSFLSALDVFCLPTWARWRMEGCPVSLLEGMASGRACIGTDIPGVRDIIEHKRSGLLVPPEDAPALRSAIELLLADKSHRDRLGDAARERVRNRFSLQVEVTAHERLYEKALARR